MLIARPLNSVIYASPPIREAPCRSCRASVVMPSSTDALLFWEDCSVPRRRIALSLRPTRRRAELLVSSSAGTGSAPRAQIRPGRDQHQCVVRRHGKVNMARVAKSAHRFWLAVVGLGDPCGFVDRRERRPQRPVRGQAALSVDRDNGQALRRVYVVGRQVRRQGILVSSSPVRKQMVFQSSNPFNNLTASNT